MTTGADIISRAHQVLQDESGITYTSAQVLDWINEGQDTIAGMRPDAKTSVKIWQLVSGTVQSIPVNDLRLLQLIRNMGSDGLTPGKAIRGPIEQETLDSFDSSWHAGAAVSEVDEYWFNENVPSRFLVNPPLSAGPVYVEGIISVLPAQLALDTDNIDLSREYEAALLEWLLFRLLERDHELSPSYGRAAIHLQNFMQILGFKRQRVIEISPRNQEYLK